MKKIIIVTYILEFICFLLFAITMFINIIANNTNILCYGIIFLILEFKFNIDRTLYEIKSNKGNN